MESKFTGGLLGLIGITILQFLLILITLGIGAPWAFCMRERWIANHTIIDGHRLVFDGKGIQLFGKYILWFLLTLITLGIYGLWMGINIKKWVVKHTHMLINLEAPLANTTIINNITPAPEATDNAAPQEALAVGEAPAE